MVVRSGLDPVQVMLEAMRAHYDAGRLDEAARMAERVAPYTNPKMPAAHIVTGNIPPLRQWSLADLQRVALELRQDEYHEVQDDDGKPGGQESPDIRKPAGEGTG